MLTAGPCGFDDQKKKSGPLLEEPGVAEMLSHCLKQ